MKLFALSFFALCFGAVSSLFAQALAPRTPAASSANATQLQELIKKVDEQNAKIDMLSQQILKLEQQLSASRPGVMVSEATPTTSTSIAPTSTTTPAPEVSAHPSTVNGNSHVVARGETLTSIAKMYNVSVSELQKYNHIENDRKLQIGQTIMIPSPAAPAAASSPPK